MQALAEVMHLDSEHAYHIARSLKEYLSKTEPDADVDMRSPEETAADERFMQLMASEPDDEDAEAELHTRDADEDFFQHLKDPEVEAEEAESNIPDILARGLEFLHLKDPRIDKSEAESWIASSDDDLTARSLHQLASPRIDDAEAEARLAALEARSPSSDETWDEAFNFGKHNYGFPATLTHPASLTHPSGQTGGRYTMRARALPSISLPPTPVETQMAQATQTAGLWKNAVAAFLHKYGGEWNAAKVKPHEGF